MTVMAPALSERHEAAQQAAGLVQLVAQTPAQVEVIAGRPGQPGHAAPPGHGRATADSARRSTLA